MKILFLERSLGWGGAQRQLVALAIGLMERGHHVTVALFYDEGPLIRDIRAHGISLKILSKKGRWDVFGFLRSILSLLKVEAPDILCTFLPVPNLIAAVCRLLSPKYRLVWGVRASNVDLQRYDALTRLSYRLEVLGSRVPDVIVSNSKAGRSTVVSKGFPDARVVVIPNGIDTQRFRPDPVGRQTLRASWNLTDTDILVGIIGRLDPMKDHRTFLQAATSVALRIPNARFVCVGDEGPILREDLISLAASLGIDTKMIWSNGRDDMAAVFSACDVICSSSAYGEGFSNVLAEAMACARRCVATDVGDAHDIVATTGHIVPPANVVALADGMIRLCQEVARDGVDHAAARQRIQQNFSMETMIHSFEREFEQLVA